jgi:hypothetical protein
LFLIFLFFFNTLKATNVINNTIVTVKKSDEIDNVSTHLGLAGYNSHQQGLKGGQGGLIII